MAVKKEVKRHLRRARTHVSIFLAISALLFVHQILSGEISQAKLAVDETNCGWIPTEQSSPSVILKEQSNSNRQQRWENKHKIVHVITTRLFQHQPKLLHLGWARFELFRTVTLPSIRAQSNQEFLFIILTDPNLHPSLREALVAEVSSSNSNGNFALIASNQNFDTFQEAKHLSNINEDSVWTKNHELVKDYYKEARSGNRTVLTTRLDADDGLWVDFVAAIQDSAFESLHKDWLVWCIKDHIEWHYNSVSINNENKERNNHTTISAVDGNYYPGELIPKSLPQFCVTPGLTWGTAAGFFNQAHHPPGGSHHTLHARVPRCRDGPAKMIIRSKCRKSIENIGRHGNDAAAIRARTPTSAGMGGVAVDVDSNGGEAKKEQLEIKSLDGQEGKTTTTTLNGKKALLWGSTVSKFGLDLQQMRRTIQHLEYDMPGIVADALVGQCTKGHSCKKSSRKKLLALQNLEEQWAVQGE